MFWAVEYSYPLIGKMNIISSKKNQISTFDLSTLYNNLPHQDLMRVLQKNVEFLLIVDVKTKRNTEE